ncbi:MAG: aldolase/citrate lyase family protein [Actinomycetota bacterium]|nr:aldolase/citrate lyase family protein [Actinomycetota bacterium]
MRANPVKQQLREGEPTVGTWLSTGSSVVAEICARSGFSWLVVDLEHSGADYGIALGMLQAIATTDTVPFVLIPWCDPKEAKRALDIGAYGIVVPNVKTPGEAEAAVLSCKYPPEGERGVGTLRGVLYGGADYYEHANDEIAVVVMIEDAEAVGRIDEIMAIPGVDCFHIGPYDLAASLGVPYGLDNPHPVHREAVERVLHAGQHAGVPVGIHCGTAAEVERRIEEGFSWLALATDGTLLMETLRRDLGQIRSTIDGYK